MAVGGARARKAFRGERRAGGDTSGTPLGTDEMRGDAAPGNMTALDFGDTWVPTDGYPVLAWQTRDMGSGAPRDGSVEETTSEGGTRTDGENGTDTDPTTDGEGTTPTDDTDRETDRETDGEADTDDPVDDAEAQPGFAFVAPVVAVVASLSLRYRDR